MNLHHVSFLVLATAMVGCSARTIKQPINNESSKPAVEKVVSPASPDPNATFPLSVENSTALSLIQAVAKDPTVLKKKWKQYSVLFPGCTRVNVYPGNLICPPIDGLISIAAGDGPFGVIDFQLKSPINCETIYQTVKPILGNGKVRVMSSEKCDVEWILNSKKVKKGHVNLYTFSMDSKIVIFQMAIEQGP